MSDSTTRSISNCIAHCDHILAEGSIVERVNRDSTVELDPHIGYSSLIFDRRGREILEGLYREYLDIGRRHDLPFFGLTPTWRANPERVKQSGYNDFRKINADCVAMYRNIIASYGSYAEKVYLGGLMACRGDAYRPEEALTAAEAEAFHHPQAEALADAGVDCIKAATLPAFTEAAGMAKVFSDLNVDSVLSFVLTRNGNLLDGTPLEECIQRIDDLCDNPPVCYMVNCIHPTVLTEAAGRLKHVADRIQGIQANTSRLSPEELDNLAYLDEEDPEAYSDCLLEAGESLNLKIIGGCCGTDGRHIEAVAAKLDKQRKSRQSRL